jgi:hypothetical protein
LIGAVDESLARLEQDRLHFSNSVVHGHSFAISPLIHASFAGNVVPLKSEGAGNAGRAMRPQPRMQNKMSIRA